MKSTVKNLFAAAFMLSLCCCSPKGDGSVTEIVVNGNKMYQFSLNSLKSNVKTVPLSSLVDDCRLVQLETKDEAYFKPWFTTVTNKYIGVRQQDGRPYMLFSSSGKFLCNVGAVGQGPGEYSIQLYDDIIDENNELIYLSCMNDNKILVYKTSGEFLKNIVSPQELHKPKIYLSDGILTVVHMPFRNDKAVAIQFDVKSGEVLRELPPPPHLIVQSFDGELFNTRNTPGIFDFLHTGSDTLYHFDVKNNTILPFFMMTFNSSEKPYKQYFQLNKDLLLTFVFGKGLVATDLKNKISSFINVTNDFYGNIPAPTYIIHLRNGYWVNNVQPEQLIIDIEKRLADSSCSDNDRKKLKETLSNIKEGDNNVVFIGKLKSEVNNKLF